MDVENVKNVLEGRYFGNAKSKADGGNEISSSSKLVVNRQTISFLQ